MLLPISLDDSIEPPTLLEMDDNSAEQLSLSDCSRQFSGPTVNRLISSVHSIQQCEPSPEKGIVSCKKL